MDNAKSKIVFYQIIIALIFVLGITFRTIVFSYYDVFEDDECRLILAFIEKDWLQIFLSLGDAQSAPPFFIMLGKILGNITGYCEQALKLIPYIASLCSIFVFYQLSEKLFVNNYTKILANILFAINFKLIIFSSIFKQYSTDVLVCMLCLLLFPKLNLDNLNRKELAIIGIIILLLPFISLPSMFFIGTFFLINIKHLKKLLPIIIPFFVIMALYYCYNLYPSKISLDIHFPNYWDNGFMKFGNILMILKMIFGYFFSPNHFVLFETILFLLGIYFTVKDKSLCNNYILATSVLIILASFLRLYPLEGRVALYCVPILIFFMLKPIDSVNLKSYKFFTLSLLFILGFCGYNLTYFKSFGNETPFITYSPKKLLQILDTNFNPNTDIVLCNNASTSSFLFYSSKIGFQPDNVRIIPTSEDKEVYENYIKNFLNKLPNSKRYWLYLIKDYQNSPVFDLIIDWSNNEDKLDEYTARKSHLILVKRK